jgi:Spy/CpxP family protein refolding chaperone
MRFPWKYILVSFVLGLLLGGSAGLFAGHHGRRPWGKKGPEMFVRHLDKKIHLTDLQRTQILTLVTTGHDKIDAVMEDTRQSTDAQIRALLTPDQLAGFNALVAKHEAERRKQEGH